MSHCDFFKQEIQVGDFVYRNEKVHKVLKIAKDNEYGQKRIRVLCIYPYTWMKSALIATSTCLKMTDEQVALMQYQMLKRK